MHECGKGSVATLSLSTHKCELASHTQAVAVVQLLIVFVCEVRGTKFEAVATQSKCSCIQLLLQLDFRLLTGSAPGPTILGFMH